jgi:flavin reductase (DIM6/NTAB) family NADH-FMN oxidoreductase RutF/DNA-binding IclR family transcriptional regulator
MDRPAPADTRWFREVLGQYPTGVCVVTATEPDGARAGFVVGSFTSVSLNPPLVAFFPDRSSTSWPRIERAGRFCVNILSADQEGVCRQFASKGNDKYQGLDVRAAGSGSPIIEGVVAWIDCEIESVHEAGDHYAVYGRVLDLNVENGSLPLLFFLGGYGRFAPLSMAAPTGRTVSAERLRQVDLVRGEMERLASDLSARCIATCVQDERLVVLASAGSAASTSLPTLVGVDLPFVPPNGNALAAWQDPTAIDGWLQVLPDADLRDEQRGRLAAVRHRGYSLGLINDAQREFASALDKLARDPLAVEQTNLTDLVTRLSYDPVELTEATMEDVRVIAVPVFDSAGEAALAFTVHGFSRPEVNGGIGGYIARAREASRRATELLGGRLPEAGGAAAGESAEGRTPVDLGTRST